MRARIWIAHQRYPTKGRVWHPAGAHPFIGMNEALVHNGDFANYFGVTEYLRQRNLVPQFPTDTEVSVLLFDLLTRVYGYPLEYVIEAMAPTTEIDFDALPEQEEDLPGHPGPAHARLARRPVVFHHRAPRSGPVPIPASGDHRPVDAQTAGVRHPGGGRFHRPYRF